MFPNLSIEIGYGSAYQSIKPTGKSETAVPITGAYKSCQRTFGEDHVYSTDEFRSTICSWEFSVRKENVFRIVDSEILKEENKPFYICHNMHTNAKTLPVHEHDKGLVSRYIAACTARDLWSQAPFGGN